MLRWGNVAPIRGINLHDSDDVVVTVRSEQLGEKILEKHQSIAPKKLQYVVVEDITSAGAMDKVCFPERNAWTR